MPEPTTPPEHLNANEELAQARSELAAAQSAARRLRIAYARGLPLELAERLNGEDDNALQADAARLAALMKPASPGVPPPPATMSPPRADLLTLSAEEVRKHKKELMRSA